MSLADDSTISQQEAAEIRAEAERLLRNAVAVGVFPTPVDEILRAAKIEVLPIALDEGYLAQLRRKAAAAGQALLRAISKVWGVFDPKTRIAFIDPETPKEKLPFLKLHEGGHAVLPWQSIFGIFEDCRKTLDPEVKLQFEREANVFASEVLFQLDGFTAEARDHAFGLNVPLKLAKRYGASVYATIRRYVSHSDKLCAVLVLNPPQPIEGAGFMCTLRRAIVSPAFARRFAGMRWPDTMTPDDQLGRLVPVNRMTGPRPLRLTDANGEAQDVVAEAFKTPHQVFILIHCTAKAPPRIILPASVAS